VSSSSGWIGSWRLGDCPWFSGLFSLSSCSFDFLRLLLCLWFFPNDRRPWPFDFLLEEQCMLAERCAQLTLQIFAGSDTLLNRLAPRFRSFCLEQLWLVAKPPGREDVAHRSSVCRRYYTDARHVAEPPGPVSLRWHAAYKNVKSWERRSRSLEREWYALGLVRAGFLSTTTKDALALTCILSIDWTTAANITLSFAH